MLQLFIICKQLVHWCCSLIAHINIGTSYLPKMVYASHFILRNGMMQVEPNTGAFWYRSFMNEFNNESTILLCTLCLNEKRKIM